MYYLGEMTTVRKTALPARLFRGDDEPRGKPLDETSEEFLAAFCELLDTQSGRDGDPIVVLPDGPVTIH